MASITIEVPAMYADHHVVEVRQMLLDVPGVDTVYASSAFRIVEIEFDESAIAGEDLKSRLDAAGYCEQMQIPEESGEPTAGIPRFQRRTTTNQAAGANVSFRQELAPVPEDQSN